MANLKSSESAAALLRRLAPKQEKVEKVPVALAEWNGKPVIAFQPEDAAPFNLGFTKLAHIFEHQDEIVALIQKALKG